VEHDTHYAQYFTCKENTEETLQYLLEVSSGLRSLVIGDMQIISQVKQSFLKAQAQNVQGTILERAIQTAFKMHKRIQNETDFRNGSASTSYLALLAARQKFGTTGLTKKNVLLIGAGEIIKDVAKYSDKFKFQSITIINRTRETAQKLAQNYGFKVGDWDSLASAIEAADIVISGVSNQANLVSFTQNLAQTQTSKLFIDLGMPANIDVRLSENPNFTLIDIDNLSTKTEQVATQRQTAINTVRKIIETESKDFFKWLQKVPVNKSLSKLKTHIQDLLEKELSANFGYLPDTERQKLIQRLSQQLIKQPAITLNQKPDNALATALEMVFDL
jgi:glutamyl-tRNA reductase